MDEVITIQRVLKHQGVTCTPEDVSTNRNKNANTVLCCEIGGARMETCVQGALFTRNPTSGGKMSEGISTSTV